MEIGISEARARLPALINAALAGEQVVLTKHGRPVAEIRPFATVKKPAEKLSAIRMIFADKSAIMSLCPDAFYLHARDRRTKPASLENIVRVLLFLSK